MGFCYNQKMLKDNLPEATDGAQEDRMIEIRNLVVLTSGDIVDNLVQRTERRDLRLSWSPNGAGKSMTMNIPEFCLINWHIGNRYHQWLRYFWKDPAGSQEMRSAICPNIRRFIWTLTVIEYLGFLFAGSGRCERGTNRGKRSRSRWDSDVAIWLDQESRRKDSRQRVGIGRYALTRFLILDRPR